VTARDLDVESTFDDPDDGWFGAAQPADATPARHVQAPPRDDHPSDLGHGFGPAAETDHSDDPADDTDRWFVQDMNLAGPVELEDPPRDDAEDPPVTESVTATLNVVPTRRNGFVGAAAPSSWESRLSNSGAWEFKATSDGAWYRSKAVMTAAAVVAGAVAIVGVVMVLRAPAVEESSPVAPSESAAPPAPSTSAPALSSVAPLPSPPPPPGPPPPPPPSAEEISPPVVPRQYAPRYQTPDEPKKPQTNVTRAPMSATPPPPPRETNRGRATPGESGSHGFFG
jgi:hypothetical protein